MKKHLLTALAALTLGVSSAQTSFLEKTCYRGAFAPAPTPMWTNGWTEWDPQNKVYPAPTVTITGNITANTTWSTGQTVLLSAQVFVKNNSVLTIQAGVTILGDKAIAGAGLFICKGSKLIANGTSTNPIVFTSNQTPGNRALGDWGGVVLLGQASNNNPGGINNVEGLPVSTDTEYGGGTTPNDNDNSGSLQYVRIEFGGYVYQPNKEINGLTFGAVGRGTTIDNVQVSFANDDAFEWFGGTVNCKHLIAYRCLDDDFDTDNGFSGNVQFCLGVRDPQISDNPAVSTSEGFESDNDPTGSAATPTTSAIFSNVTEIGPLRGVLTATYASGYRRSARIRRNSGLKIVNSILMDAATRGVFIDGSACETNANAGTLVFKNNIVAGYGQRCMETGTFGVIAPSANGWVSNAGQGNDTLNSTNGILITPYNYLTPDYRPSQTSIASAGASFTFASIAANTSTFASNNAVAGIPSTLCISNGTTIIPGTFVATTTVSNGYCGLSWVVPSGIAISSSTAINPSFTVSTLGTFTITLQVTDANGTQSIPQSITTTTCVNASVKEISNNIGSINVYPNPSNEKVNVSVYALNSSNINLQLFDITGKLISNPVSNHNLSIGDNNISISTKELNNGIYFVTLSNEFGKETVKLIVNH